MEKRKSDRSGKNSPFVKVAESIVVAAKPNQKQKQAAALAMGATRLTINRDNSFDFSVADDSTKYGSMLEIPSQIYGLQDFSRHALHQASDMTNNNQVGGEHSFF